ncbi:MAG: hypothetical protein NTV24_03855, partial [Candidatus Woesebacteria bacterium]|nr:hypothetical protein [Candidatus Woesebacteria bacterium]
MAKTGAACVLDRESAVRVLTAIIPRLSGMTFLPTSLVGNDLAGCLLHRRGRNGECYLSVITILKDLKERRRHFSLDFREGEPTGRKPFSPRIWWEISEWEDDSELGILLKMFHLALLEIYKPQKF